MKKTLLVATSIAILAVGGLVAAQVTRTKAPATAKAYIISPKNGATVTSPVTVQFGLKGMGVAPAGVTNENTGHFHLLIDTDTMPDMNAPLPKTDKIVHFGGGQIETEVTLTPGKHTLQLLMADANHVPHDPPVMSEKITVTVSGAAAKTGATSSAPKASTTKK